MTADVRTRLRDVSRGVGVAVVIGIVIGIVIAVTTYYGSFPSYGPPLAN